MSIGPPFLLGVSKVCAADKSWSAFTSLDTHQSCFSTLPRSHKCCRHRILLWDTHQSKFQRKMYVLDRRTLPSLNLRWRETDTPIIFSPVVTTVLPPPLHVWHHRSDPTRVLLLLWARRPRNSQVGVRLPPPPRPQRWPPRTVLPPCPERASRCTWEGATQGGECESAGRSSD